MDIKLKICGITSLEDARYCAAAGADFLGFIQYKNSPRYIEPELVKQVSAWIYGAEPVGVFVNESLDAVNQCAFQAGFSYVQLHGTETPEFCTNVERPVIKAIHVTSSTSTETLRQIMRQYVEVVKYFLLDTKKADLWGGTGQSFDWSIAQGLSTEFPCFLAGGIGADNVGNAITAVRPFGIDVSSRVESSPGKKDYDKLAAFLEVYRQYNKVMMAKKT